MLAFAPTPIQDELIYSYMGRWFALSGHSKRLAFMYSAVGTDCRLLTPDVYGNFNIETEYSLVLDRPQILLNHTIFPFYAQFLPEKLVDKIIRCCWEGDLRVSKSWLDRADLTPKSLRFCMECAKEQLREHGCAYWTRPHNLPFVRACYKHKTTLVSVADKVLDCGPEQFVFPEIDAKPSEIANDEEVRIAVRAFDTLHESIGEDRYSLAVMQNEVNGTKRHSPNVAQVRVQLRQDLHDFRKFAMDTRYSPN